MSEIQKNRIIFIVLISVAMLNNYFGSNLKFLRKKTVKSQSDIAILVNKRTTAISSWENNLSQPSFEDLFRLSDFFGIDIGLLLANDLSDESSSKSKSNALGNAATDSLTEYTYNVYDFESKAAAGEALFLLDADRMMREPNLYLPHLGPGLHIRVPISGDSMHSTIKDSDKAVATLVTDISDIRQGYIYAILDKQDGLVCKRVYMENEKTLELVSDNEIYKPYKRHLKDIVSMFKVREVHSTDLRPYFEDLRKEMRDIRTEMADIRLLMNK
ncbi:LexA family transcriptional regulator [Taibaiella lutea]|nr:S24 family peptidase [Taibaiella lutea]